jgi:hypothetical protein
MDWAVCHGGFYLLDYFDFDIVLLFKKKLCASGGPAGSQTF